MRTLFPLLLGLLFSLSGCSTALVQPTEFSGFLTHYEHLTETTGVDGEPTLRWTSSEFTADQYQQVLIHDPVFYPPPQTSAQVSQETLDELIRYSSKKLQTEAAKRKILAQIPGPGVISLRTAMTGVRISPESLTPLEVIPFKLVLAGAAIGFRDHDLVIYYEIIGEDSLNQTPLFSVVRKVRGETLDSKWDQMDASDMQDIIDRLSRDGMAALAQQLNATSTQSQHNIDKTMR